MGWGEGKPQGSPGSSRQPDAPPSSPLLPSARVRGLAASPTPGTELNQYNCHFFGVRTWLYYLALPEQLLITVKQSLMQRLKINISSVAIS